MLNNLDNETYGISFEAELDWVFNVMYHLVYYIALVAEWLRVRLRVRMVKGSTLTVGNFLSLENLNVIIRAIN